MSEEPDERDFHEEHQDRELLEEAERHPERFARYPQTQDTERPTPITDARWKEIQRADDSLQVFLMTQHARNLERQLADHKEALEITNRSADDQMFQKREAERQLAACQSGNRSLADALDKVREQLDAERALADRLADALKAAVAYPVTGNWWGDAQDVLTAWKEARQ